jgi:lysine 2,3-aminomutase
VLLGGINDDAATMRAREGLVRMRVRPYYCYQAQLLEGTAHFRVPIERGIEIQGAEGPNERVRDPTYVLDTPYGKVP